MANFGTRLKKLRTSKNLTGEELGNIFNVTKTAVSNWENSNRFPDEDMLVKIADYFDVTLDYLLGRADNPKGIISAADIDGHHYEFELDKTVFSNGLTYEQMLKALEEYTQVKEKLKKAGLKFEPNDEK